MNKHSYRAVEAFRGADKTIRVVGHRGARGMVPENTMVGFKSTIELGINLLEFDVVLCADGIPVITHNHALHAPTCKRVGGDFIDHEPKVLDLTWSQLQCFEVGRLDSSTQYGQRFPDQFQFDGIKVPQLDELLAYVASFSDNSIYLMLEIKSDPTQLNNDIFRRKLVTEIVQRVHAFDLVEQTLLHSFDWRILEECRSLAPEFPTSFLTQINHNPADVDEDSSLAVGPNLKDVGDNIADIILEQGGSLWCPNVQDITTDALTRAKNLGLVTAVWTVNALEEIDRMIEYGVDAIITDYPGRVQQRLADYGYNW